MTPGPEGCPSGPGGSVIAAEPDGQPVGGVSSAAPGYHIYSRDHLLLTGSTPQAAGNRRPPLGSSPSCHDRTTRYTIIPTRRGTDNARAIAVHKMTKFVPS